MSSYMVCLFSDRQICDCPSKKVPSIMCQAVSMHSIDDISPGKHRCCRQFYQQTPHQDLSHRSSSWRTQCHPTCKLNFHVLSMKPSHTASVDSTPYRKQDTDELTTIYMSSFSQCTRRQYSTCNGMDADTCGWYALVACLPPSTCMHW